MLLLDFFHSSYFLFLLVPYLRIKRISKGNYSWKKKQKNPINKKWLGLRYRMNFMLDTCMYIDSFAKKAYIYAVWKEYYIQPY